MEKMNVEELFEDLMSVIHSFSMKADSKLRLAKRLLEGKDEQVCS